MRRVPLLATAALAAGALAIGVGGAATAGKPSGGGTSGALTVSLTTYSYDSSAQSCNLSWNFSDTTGKSVQGYKVNLTTSPQKQFPTGRIWVPGPNGYEVNGLPAGATSYFYVQAVYTDGKSSSVVSSNKHCG